jgi:hypothetical protein
MSFGWGIARVAIISFLMEFIALLCKQPITGTILSSAPDLSNFFDEWGNFEKSLTVKPF